MTQEQLQAIVAGDRAVHQIAGVRLRLRWFDEETGTPCPLCGQHQHLWQTHMYLLPQVKRELPRGAPRSRIRDAEIAWERATGQAMRIEDILRQEMQDKYPPTGAYELAETLGVDGKTVTTWARRLDVPVQSKWDWMRYRKRANGLT